MTRILRPLIMGLILTSALASCKKLIDVDAKEVLESQNMYKNVFDADAAVIGLYGKFLKLAEQQVVLNELRADLLTTTANADDELRQIEHHNAQPGNRYTDPKPYYDVLLNCNDILRNFDRMLRDKKILEADYNVRYADVATIRSWVYLQLGIQFGRVPYITSSLPNLDALKQVMASAEYQPVSFDNLLDSLIAVQEHLPFQSSYPAATSLITTVDGYATTKFFINKQVMLGQLYLWRGKGQDYHNAAVAFKSVMETGGTGNFFTYRITGASKADNNDIAVSYIRYQEENENSLVNNNNQGWRSIFARAEDKLFGYEWIWYLPYNTLFRPENPFRKLFSSSQGSYLLKPSQEAIDNWNGQTQKNNFPYDARGPKFSYNIINGQPEVMKYQYAPGTEKWFLYRAAALNLDFAEAANRDGHPAIADAIVNQGIQPAFGKILVNEGDPYIFDARKSDNPSIAGDWYLNAGLRGRASLYSVPVMTDSLLSIEDNTLNERALELAFEGARWSDLLRIARRRNDPGYLANRIYAKLVKQNDPNAAAVKAKLMNPDNWYLPFQW
ncbi:RagB/SusD family nutrient uptake outer membrane protein [Niabella aurantiaca]|uniref:RagB/SusD family nutrient uptake outer membrane protein n=1 Tax=Niabella aurantiaca TaxID=379900 RepID=UPI0003A6250B|nr:RagB/SusD family nutrient uptake outer membrane protein [Niabella aurantiaca]